VLVGGAAMQFSLGTMLIVIAALAVVLATVGTPMMAVFAFVVIECSLWFVTCQLVSLTYKLGNRGRPYSGFLVLITAMLPLAAAMLLPLFAIVAAALVSVALVSAV
jgi:hypothetical protein